MRDIFIIIMGLITIMLILTLLVMYPEKKVKEKILPTNTTIKVKDFDCYGLIVDSLQGQTKYYKLRYQTNTGEIIDQSFKAEELDTIPWTNLK